MSQQIPFHFRMCATCTYWAGCRELDTFGTFSIIEDGQPFGRCMNPESGWYKGSSMAQNCCTKYEKWPAMH